MPKFSKKKEIEEADKAWRVKRNRIFSRLRGMKDILPDEYKYWNLVIKKATDLARTYSYRRLETPILELQELYERTTGKSSDIVTKEMFAFIDKNGDRVALRPEATPSIVRSYIEHGMFNLPQPVKLFWLGPVFRHDKPQAGRFRQFSQYNLENIGEASPVADSELILIAYNFFRELQVEVIMQINSLGCKDCRREYIAKLQDYYKERGKRSKLCNDCKKRLITNPLRLLDCKEKGCIEIAGEAPQLIDSLCEDCRNHFIKVLEYLDDLDIAYNLNPYLVRGLDYYTKTVFEIWPVAGDNPAEETGRQSALGGGGRYDGLVEYMGGRPTPASGFAIGIERVILKIKEKNIPLKEEEKVDLFLAQLGEQPRRKAMKLFEELRRAGFNIRQAFSKDSLKNQLEVANRLGVKYSLILGQKEIMDGTILLRDMESGIQEVIDYKKIEAEINKRLANGDK